MTKVTLIRQPEAPPPVPLKDLDVGDVFVVAGVEEAVFLMTNETHRSYRLCARLVQYVGDPGAGIGRIELILEETLVRQLAVEIQVTVRGWMVCTR